jgi:hypothetical protein
LGNVQDRYLTMLSNTITLTGLLEQCENTEDFLRPVKKHAYKYQFSDED